MHRPVDNPVLYFTLELSEFLLSARFVSSLTGIAAKNILQNELSDNEKEAIIQALSRAQNNKSEAAKLLKITRKTLYNKLKHYNID